MKNLPRFLIALILGFGCFILVTGLPSCAPQNEVSLVERPGVITKIDTLQVEGVSKIRLHVKDEWNTPYSIWPYKPLPHNYHVGDNYHINR